MGRWKDPQYFNKWIKKYRMTDRGKLQMAKWRMKSRYNVTPQQISSYLKFHDNKCAICKQDNELVIDHCHTQKKFRGMLCRACNLLIGYAHDNPEVLESAINYLNFHNQEFKGCYSGRPY